MIRATREWGGKKEQGRAFGILEGGRGLVAAAISTVAVLLIGFFLPADPTMASDAQRVSALQSVIFVYTGITFFTGLLVWFLVPEAPRVTVEARSEQSRRDILEVLRSPTVWLQALII
ncbi:MAG: MFS transporter, partial [Deltaproteobacteria bacterium]|nr:MFS transporter [Deltaproteobacteria bacterium]